MPTQPAPKDLKIAKRHRLLSAEEAARTRRVAMSVAVRAPPVLRDRRRLEPMRCREARPATRARRLATTTNPRPVTEHVDPPWSAACYKIRKGR